MNNELTTLTNRSLLLVSGNDSEDFLQSIITIDLSGNSEELLSSCFLSPQGKLLNQFFCKKRRKSLPVRFTQKIISIIYGKDANL